MQNKNKIIVTKLNSPVVTALMRIPFPATILTVHRCRSNRFAPRVHGNNAYLAFLVSSAICPDASKPVSDPAVNKLMRCSINLNPARVKMMSLTSTKASSIPQEPQCRYLNAYA